MGIKDSWVPASAPWEKFNSAASARPRTSSPTVASVPLTSSDSRMPAQPADAATGGGRWGCDGPDRTEVLEAAEAADRTDPAMEPFEGSELAIARSQPVHPRPGA